MTLRFGTDGVRGAAHTELTDDAVTALAAAADQVLGGGVWIVGRDTRESSPAFAAAFAAGVARSCDLGVLPTPALAFLSQRRGAPAAMITASHNPWHDNGVKVFAKGGAKLADVVEDNIEQAWHATRPPARPAAPVSERDPDAWRAYADHLVEVVPRLDAMTVVLDCANGAMSAVAPHVLRRLGANTITIHDQPDGTNINASCGATHPASLTEAVIGHGAQLGLAFDGDGDRVIAVDERGQVVDGDRLLGLAALRLRRLGRLHHDTVVVTVMTNLGFHHAMRAADINVHTTGVGDRYVLEALDAGGFSVGGEQSGHIIYRDLATTGDGLLAGLQLAVDLNERGQSLSHAASMVMTTVPQVLVNVRVAQRHPNIAAELADEIAAAEVALGADGRILVRASGTEPLIRVMVEAAGEGDAKRVAHRLAGVVEQRYG